MSNPEHEISPSEFAWLTSLARALTGVDADADDLVQQTWLAARRSPPAKGGINRPWLARVLKRFHLQSLRSEGRRRRRELSASRRESLPSAAELVERAELQRTLADRLIELDEPYRSTLMLVAFEFLTTAEIAERQGVSAAIVRYRLRRARELFKEKLKAFDGREWHSWCATLLPLARAPLPHEIGIRAGTASLFSLAQSPLIVIGGLAVASKFMVLGTLGVGVVAFLWMTSQSQDPDTPTLVQAHWAGETEPLRRTPNHVSTSGARTAPTEDSMTSPPSPPPELPSPVVGERRFIRGTILVQDEFGAIDEAADGEFFTQSRRRVEVSDGAWQLEYGLDEQLKIDIEAEFNGRAALINTSSIPVAIIRDGLDIVLRAKWLAPSQLAVVDATTGAHLSGLTLVRGGLGQRFPHPGHIDESNVVTRNGNSPVTITPPSVFADTYFARCRGYAWGLVRLDHVDGGKRELRLERGEASLIVHVFGDDRENASLRLSSVEIANAELTLPFGGDQPRTIEHLAIGSYTVEAMVSASGARAKQQVALSDGINEIRLELPQIPSALRGPVSGVLHLPEPWRGRAKTLLFKGPEQHKILLDRMEPDPTQEGAWRFSAGELRDGRYQIAIPEIGWATAIDVPAAGLTLTLKVPPPGIAVLRITDANTGAIINSEVRAVDVLWSSSLLRLRSGGTQPLYDEDSETWRIVAPQSEITVTVMAHMDYLSEQHVLTVGPEPIQRDIRLRRAAMLVLDLFEGESSVPTDFLWASKVQIRTSSDGNGLARFGMNGRDFVLMARGSGSFLLKFPEIDGYLPIPDAEIRLEEGVLTRHRIQVRRR